MSSSLEAVVPPVWTLPLAPAQLYTVPALGIALQAPHGTSSPYVAGGGAMVTSAPPAT